MKRIIAASIVCMSAQAFAGVPEFDAVGDDSSNYFNDAVRASVVGYNVTDYGVKINKHSDFEGEKFHTSASGPRVDPCFYGYKSYFAGPRNVNEFHWEIVLQMKPETDLDLTIRDCVLDSFGHSIWMDAAQTGRYRESNGALVFSKSSNPRVTVQAMPGPRNSFEPFYLDARTMPGLHVTPLFDAKYTSKALWEETLVMVMPEDGAQNKSGEDTVRLREGDKIVVWIDIPGTNPNSIFYGKDNVAIEYVGEPYTWLHTPVK